MKFKDIQLEQVTREEYLALTESWGVNPRKEKSRAGKVLGSIWSKITRTVVYSSYGDLINDFLKTDFADHLWVRGKGKNSRRIYPVQVNGEKIREAVELAKENPFKRGFLETKFSAFKRDRLQMVFSFAEENGLILLSEVNAPFRYNWLLDFDSEDTPLFHYNNGVLSKSCQFLYHRP